MCREWFVIKLPKHISTQPGRRSCAHRKMLHCFWFVSSSSVRLSSSSSRKFDSSCIEHINLIELYERPTQRTYPPFIWCGADCRWYANSRFYAHSPCANVCTCKAHTTHSHTKCNLQEVETLHCRCRHATHHIIHPLPETCMHENE